MRLGAIGPGRLLAAGALVMAVASTALPASPPSSASSPVPAVVRSPPRPLAPGLTEAAPPNFIGANADPARTSWWPDEAALPPSEINSRDFGERFSRQLSGEILAEPLVSDGVLLAVTENNWAYGLNPATGAVEWSVNYGPPQPSSSIPDICGDITPSFGITGTPVIDPATDIAYFTTDVYLSGAPQIYLQAVHVADGAAVAGFPVRIEGSAGNSPTESFDPDDELQRPGLALVNGVVYAGFGSHCDLGEWIGWIAGVSTAGHITDLWSTEPDPSLGEDAGIWQSGGGIVVDAQGNLYFATGNGGEPTPGPTITDPQPGGLGNCVVELSTTGGTLRLKDYFCPFDAPLETSNDWDLGSGGPVLLPASFGTAKTPDLLVEAGKQGEVYLLDAERLGGMTAQFPDHVVQELGPFGGVWSKPAVWPGDGGFVYLPTASGGKSAYHTAGALDIYERFVDVNDDVSLEQVGAVPDFGFGSSSPIVTSNGTRPGSAVVWIVRFPPGGVVGAGATLDAYAANPVAGPAGQGATLAPLFSAPVGQGATFDPPLASGPDLYVANEDGDILCFGPRSGSPDLEGNAVAAADTFLGTTTRTAASFKATGTTTVDNVTVDNTTTGASSAFSATAQTLPVTVGAGQYFVVPLEFRPEILGGQDATLTVTTSHGTVSVPLSGRGLPNSSGAVVASPEAIDFGPTAIGAPQTHEKLTFRNDSASPVTVSDLVLPSGPFSLSGVEHLPATLQPKASTTMTVTFTPPATSGDFPHVFTADITLDTSTGSELEVPVEGTASPRGVLAVGAVTVAFGRVARGQSRIAAFTVGNTGGLPVRITISSPPSSSGFTAVTRLPVGRWIAPHGVLTEIVRYRPKRPGTARATWHIGIHGATETVTFEGVAARLRTLPDPGRGGWRLNGSATLVPSGLRLTRAVPRSKGSAFWSRPIPSDNLSVSFTERTGGGSGGDGMTLTLADAAKAGSHSLGGGGAALGFGGIDGVAIALSTQAAGGNHSSNSVGLVTARSSVSRLDWQVIDGAIPDLRPGPHVIEVSVSHDIVSVSVDGTAAFSVAAHVPPMIYLGFTASTGRPTDVHEALHLQIADPGASNVPQRLQADPAPGTPQDTLGNSRSTSPLKPQSNPKMTGAPTSQVCQRALGRALGSLAVSVGVATGLPGAGLPERHRAGAGGRKRTEIEETPS